MFKKKGSKTSSLMVLARGNSKTHTHTHKPDFLGEVIRKVKKGRSNARWGDAQSEEDKRSIGRYASRVTTQNILHHITNPHVPTRPLTMQSLFKLTNRISQFTEP